LTTPTNSDAVVEPVDLAALLRSVFGFGRFRANQEAVCRAAIAGRDLLLVMPTGFGKSLCYQLPAIALGGTALVISPLIALMEDQAAKLAALGLRVGRIHSGLDRAQARQACVDYLQGSLQFLFIAPERLRVPGFGEMLAKRKPVLIAVDEAHCISQWGHDFRPDYRMIGQYLPALRPAPVLAMTATATPSVQADIVAQLGMVKPAKFIHGFRRENLAIEVVELSMPERPGAICGLLADPARRPAIVYATSRKGAERLAEELSGTRSEVHPSGAKAHDDFAASTARLKSCPDTDQYSSAAGQVHVHSAGPSRRIPAAAYHAGLDSATRERVQTAFQAGELEVVVATIAFGMGIDKADIRTVIHAGLPATLEGYYQEIGRAGRDGALSRTYLMHSYADQRTHDFFLNRDYPPVENLQQVYRALGEEPQAAEELRAASKLSEEEFDKALEKLEIHGGARVDFGGQVTAGGPGWKKTYTVQAQYRAEQFEKVLRFTTSAECRMAALVRHFGDVEDASRACGICDVCDPAGAVLRLFRRPTAVERAIVQAIADELRAVDYKAAGTLQRNLDLVGRISRNEFDGLLDAMVRAGLIEIEEAEFEKDGERIRFRKVRLSEAGREPRTSAPVELLISDGVVEEFGGRAAAPANKARTASTKLLGEPISHPFDSAQGRLRRKVQKAGSLRQAQGRLSTPLRSAQNDSVEVGHPTADAKAAEAVPAPLSAKGEALAARLKEWRAAEAKRLRVPAYVVLHDRTLTEIARARPANPKQLVEINGMGPAKAERFGEAILGLCGAAE
jgi:superfamily II DNA helicase RecQ